MQMRSSPSVRIKYFDKEAIWKALQEYLRDLKRNHPEVEKVLLFGSFARDECVPGSDIDLLIILRDSKLPFLARITQYMPSRFPVGLDVFPYTKEEARRMIIEGNLFLKRAIDEGKEVSA